MHQEPRIHFMKFLSTWPILFAITIITYTEIICGVCSCQPIHQFTNCMSLVTALCPEVTVTVMVSSADAHICQGDAELLPCIA